MHTGVELDDELVAEADLARVEEVLEISDEPAEQLLDELGLHLGGKLLVKRELFYDQVEIVMERVGDSMLNILVQLRVQEVRRVAQLKALHPQLAAVHAEPEQIIEGHLVLEEARHDGNQHCIVAETNELEHEHDQVLLGGARRVVTVAHGRERLEHPVQAEDVGGKGAF